MGMGFAEAIVLVVTLLTAMFGAIITGIAGWTLRVIYERNSLKYLRAMTFAILALGLFQTVSGSLETMFLLRDADRNKTS